MSEENIEVDGTVLHRAYGITASELRGIAKEVRQSKDGRTVFTVPLDTLVEKCAERKSTND